MVPECTFLCVSLFMAHTGSLERDHIFKSWPYLTVVGSTMMMMATIRRFFFFYVRLANESVVIYQVFFVCLFILCSMLHYQKWVVNIYSVLFQCRRRRCRLSLLNSIRKRKKKFNKYHILKGLVFGQRKSNLFVIFNEINVVGFGFFSKTYK